MPTTTVSLDSLFISSMYQTRASGVCAETVEDYAEAVKGGTKFPPLLAYLVTDRQHSGPAMVAGFHRVAAYQSAGVKECEVEVREGKHAEAWLAGFLSNQTHGLRYTNADKRQAAEKALTLFPTDSNRQLAGRMGLSHDFISRVRREMEATGAIKTVDAVTGSNGKQYRQPPETSIQATQIQAARLLSSDDSSVEQQTNNDGGDDTEYADQITVGSRRQLASVVTSPDVCPSGTRTPETEEPAEDRGDAWEPPDDDEGDQLPTPSLDVSKRALPKWMTPGNHTDPDHPYADILAKFSALTRALTVALADPENERLRLALTQASGVKRKTLMVAYGSTVIKNGEVHEGTVQFVGLGPLRTLIRMAGKRAKPFSLKEIVEILESGEGK